VIPDFGRSNYHYRKRMSVMMILRNVFCTFVVAVAIVVLMSIQGCSLLAASTIATSSDPIEVQQNKDDCGEVASTEESYEKTTTRVKHYAKVTCK
jgi:hypothetical protein